MILYYIMSISFDKGYLVALIDGKDEIFIDMESKKDVNEMELEKDIKFQPANDTKKRIINYIAGPSGSGKSYMVKTLVKNFIKYNPKSDIYLFSRLETDETLTDIEKNINRVTIDEDIYNNPITLDEIPEKSLVIFDDIDTYFDKKISDALLNLKIQILELGRHKKINCIITSHLINNSNRHFTRSIMNELTNLIIYPRSGSAYQTRYALKNYFGFSNLEIDSVLSTKDSRWVLINKDYPQYVLSEKKLILR